MSDIHALLKTFCEMPNLAEKCEILLNESTQNLANFAFPKIDVTKLRGNLLVIYEF